MRICLFIIAVTAWLAFCYFKVRKWLRRRLNCTLEAVAVVKEIHTKVPRYGDSLLYKPIYLVNGVTIDSAPYSNLFVPVSGASYPVLVNPNDYSEFLYIDNRLNKGMSADIYGCGILLIGIISLLFL